MSALYQESAYKAKAKFAVDIIAFRIFNSASCGFRITWTETREAVFILPKFYVSALSQDDRALLALQPVFRSFAPLPFYQQEYPDVMYTLASNTDQLVGPDRDCCIVEAITEPITKNTRLVDILNWIQDSILAQNDKYVLETLQFQAKLAKNTGPALAQIAKWQANGAAKLENLEEKKYLHDLGSVARDEIIREIKITTRNLETLAQFHVTLTGGKTVVSNWSREHTVIGVGLGSEASLSSKQHSNHLHFVTTLPIDSVVLFGFLGKGALKGLGKSFKAAITFTKTPKLTPVLKAMLLPNEPSMFPPAVYSGSEEYEHAVVESGSKLIPDGLASAHEYPADKKC